MIDTLKNNPQHLEAVLAWHRKEWGEDWANQFRSAVNSDCSIPVIFIAVQDGSVIGTAMLMDKDLPGREDLSPWLAGVYVQENARGNGVAKDLVECAMNAARNLGVGELWLFTHHARKLYEKLGWVFVEDVQYAGNVHALMQLKFIG